MIRNPAASARPPSVPHHEQKMWSAAELNRFLTGLHDHRLLASVVLLATTGLRRGKMVGLRWTDVDLDAGKLSVIQTITTVRGHPVVSSTKTKKSRRRVTLDVATVGALRAHKRRQAKERLAAGSASHDTGLVFTQADGGALHPELYSIGSPAG